MNKILTEEEGDQLASRLSIATNVQQQIVFLHRTVYKPKRPCPMCGMLQNAYDASPEHKIDTSASGGKYTCQNPECAAPLTLQVGFFDAQWFWASPRQPKPWLPGEKHGEG